MRFGRLGGKGARHGRRLYVSGALALLAGRAKARRYMERARGRRVGTVYRAPTGAVALLCGRLKPAATQARGSLVRVDAVSGNFDFGNTAEGEQKLYEVYGWLFGGLFDNVTNRVGDRGLEHHALGLQASKVHAHELARLEHHSRTKIVPLREVKCKPFAMGDDGPSGH